MIYNNISETIGDTPLLKLNNLKKLYNLQADIYGKLEYFNPTGSVKDRIAKAMIDDAIDKGLINSDTTIIEPTSGNTGIGLASIAAAYGLKIIIVMPETMSIERRNFLMIYGAKVVLTSGSEGMKGAINKANQLNLEISNSFIPSQFENPSNPKIHELTTAKEIYEDLSNIDIFVSGVGTGGTITGVGRYLKSKNSNIEIVAVEPSASPTLSKGIKGPHKIQGIGAGFVPNVLDTKVYDSIITIENDEAINEAKEIAKIEGVFVGISSGAAISAAIKLAKLEENKGKKIVALLPDTGDRYFSILF